MRLLKDPDARLDYGVNWDDWLEMGDALATVTWTVPTGLTIESQTNTGTIATVWLSGGVAGATYVVTCHATSTAGRIDDRSFTLIGEER